MKTKSKIKILILIFRNKIKDWNFSFNNIAKVIIIFTFIIFVIYNIYQYYFALEKNKRYSIARIIKLYQGGKGSYSVDYQYIIKYKNYEKGETIYENNPSFLNKFFFIKYDSKNPKISKILLNCPVPDSIKEAPPEGWEKLPCKCNE